MKMNKMKMLQPFHLVTYSPWPLLTSLSIMVFLSGAVNWFWNNEIYLLIYGLILIILCMIQWWRDVVRESTYQGFHTNFVVRGIKLGMILFIISEIFFFISMFWCYLHMYLSPSIEIGAIWPPMNIKVFDPYLIPLLNTLILLSSGVTLTWSHYAMFKSLKKESMISLLTTIILGLIFSYYQFIEYKEASFSIADSVYGSIFFMATGFHGLHVIIGTLFLMINLKRLELNMYSSSHHVGFELAAWYWHFVDVVWLFLYILIYYWPSI